MPRQRNAAAFTGYLAQWIDLGFGPPSLVRAVLSHFDPFVRLTLPVVDYLYLRMAEGMVAITEQSAGVAIAHFDLVTLFGQEWSDKSLAIVHFWKARCLRMQGEYDQALSQTVWQKISP